MLRKRVITALCGFPLLIAAIWFEQPLPWFAILIGLWGGLAAFEFYRLVAGAEVQPLTYFGLIWTLLFIFSPHFDPSFSRQLILTSGIALSLVWLLLRRQKKEAFAGWAWTMAGILYIGWMLSYLVALRGVEDGRNWVFLALLANSGSDTAAFFIGRAWGKHHLAPNISPHKTWEGAIAGVSGAILVSLFFILPTPLHLNLRYWQAILMGLAISISGQLGDLIESLFKRNMGAKDSGKLVAGHGGFLDRIDSVIFAGIAVYYLSFIM